MGANEMTIGKSGANASLRFFGIKVAKMAIYKGIITVTVDRKNENML